MQAIMRLYFYNEYGVCIFHSLYEKDIGDRGPPKSGDIRVPGAGTFQILEQSGFGAWRSLSVCANYSATTLESMSALLNIPD